MKLEIERDEKRCDSECPFLDAWLLDHKGKCILFNEPLIPIMRYGSCDGWITCAKCDFIYNKLKDKERSDD